MTKYERRAEAIWELQRACQRFGLHVEELTPYQFRVMGALDIYPTTRKYHYFEVGQDRGKYATAESVLRRFFPGACHGK